MHCLCTSSGTPLEGGEGMNILMATFFAKCVNSQSFCEKARETAVVWGAWRIRESGDLVSGTCWVSLSPVSLWTLFTDV